MKKSLFTALILSIFTISAFSQVDNNTTNSMTKKEYKFSTEMADGSTSDKVSKATITECIKKLSDDNFFIILNRDDNFMQAAYSKKGNSVEYKDAGKQFEADKLFSQKETLIIFLKYFKGEDDWKDDVKWNAVKY